MIADDDNVDALLQPVLLEGGKEGAEDAVNFLYLVVDLKSEDAGKNGKIKKYTNNI